MRIKRISKTAGDFPIKPNGYHYHLVDTTCTHEGQRYHNCNIYGRMIRLITWSKQ